MVSWCLMVVSLSCSVFRVLAVLKELVCLCFSAPLF
jgi:hypothetical protein